MRTKGAGNRRGREREGRDPSRAGAATTASDGSAAPGTPAATPVAGAGAPGRAGLLLDLLVLLLAGFYLAALWRQAAPAAFASDECFHAHLSEWIARHGRLPRELPEFYSGLPYFYPPLHHLLGAVAVRLAGPPALQVLNVVLTGALFALLYALPVPGISRAARRCAALLCLANPALSLYAVRFYAETLATLLAVLVVMLLLRARARPGWREGALLGVAVGAALLAKQPAGVLPVLLAALAALDLARGRRALASTMGIALAVGVAVALPFFARNALLFGNPFYPPLTDPAGIALNAMNTRLFSLAPPLFYRNALVVMGPIVPWLAAGALAWSLLRGRFTVVTGLIAGCIAFTLLAPWVPRFQPRHLNPLTAMMALLAGMVVLDALARRRRVALVAQAVLLVWGVAFAARMTGLRSGLDASPADREAYRAIAERVPAGATVLSRSTYDTFYYARRNATWPIPWGSAADQLALFTERDPDRFLAGLDRLGIGYLLVPRRATGRRFTGANHPESFIACVAALVERERLKVLWGSADQVLVGRTD